jgi:hypothetical protein
VKWSGRKEYDAALAWIICSCPLLSGRDCLVESLGQEKAALGCKC